MSNFFNYENGIMSAAARVADTIILGILWLICCVPVFTIGASSAAFYYAYNSCIRQKIGYAWKTFFASFKSNFKQATQIWLIVLGSTIILLLDCYLLGWMQGAAAWILIIQTAIIVVLLINIIWALYLFPYLSRFENPNKRAMKNAALIALANAPQSILLLVIFAICVVGFIFTPMLNLFIPALYIVCANRIQEKIFRKYMTPEDFEAQLQADRDKV